MELIVEMFEINLHDFKDFLIVDDRAVINFHCPNHTISSFHLEGDFVLDLPLCIIHKDISDIYSPVCAYGLYYSPTLLLFNNKLIFYVDGTSGF